jgi:lipopolysaccharide biosynthesis glycosyltransferase
MRKKMHIAIAFDERYFAPFCALINSIFTTNECAPIELHIIATGVSEESLAKVTRFVESKGCKIHFYSIDDPNINEFVVMSTWTKAVYYRLYFPLLVPPEVERILYIDTDTLVVGDLHTLFDVSLDGCPVAAVYDNYVKTQPLLGIEGPGEYFNSGVLLIDTVKWREMKISPRTMEYLRQYPERIRYVDQCALNAVLFKQWKRLEVKFNLLYTYIPEDLNDQELRHLLKESIIVHFTLERPWHMLCKNRLRGNFRHYLFASDLYSGRTITDFSLAKIPAWLKIRLVEFYHNQRWLKISWRYFKHQLAP